MADNGNVESMLSGIADINLQRILKAIFKYLLRDIRFGRATSTTTVAVSKNFGGGFFQGTTSSVSNREFSIAHTFGRAPYLCLAVLPLDQVNAAMPRLTVSRAADASYIYLKSPDTSQPIFVYLEG